MYEKKEHTRIIPVLLVLLLVIAAGCGAEQPDSGTTPDGTLTQPVVQPQESDSGIETPDGAAKRLAVSHERNRYYLEWLEDDAMYMIANEAANSAANSAWHYYTLSAGELQVVQGVVFDALADEANPWFLTIDDDWDTSNDTPEDEELAMAVIDSHTSRYFKPEYTAFENISN